MELLVVLFVIGITAEGATGALAAGRERMDLFGVAIIACVTAIGGGSVRDMLLGNYPLVWVKHPIYLVSILAAAFITVAIPIMMTYFHRVFLMLDAVGLSVFTVLGTQIALEQGHGAIIAIVAAVLTGVFGGVLRDILSDRLPLVFQGDLYASVSVAGSLLYLALHAMGLTENVVVIVSLTFTFLLRLFAMFFHWSLPVFEYQERDFTRDRRYSLTDFVMSKARVTRPKPQPQMRITRGLMPRWRIDDDESEDTDGDSKKDPEGDPDVKRDGVRKEKEDDE